MEDAEPVSGTDANVGRPRPSWSRRWALILGAALVALAVLVDGVRERGDLSAYDPDVTATAVTHRTGALTLVARGATFLGSTICLFVLTVLLAGWALWRRRDRALATIIAVTVATSASLTVLIKHVIGRIRPRADAVLGRINTGYSFPSGHTSNSTVFYGLAAGVMLAGIGSRRARAGVIGGWLAMTAAIAGSRIYLGYHWMTDVLAGFALGLAVLAVAALLSSRWGVAWWTVRPRPTEGERVSVVGLQPQTAKPRPGCT